MAYWGKDDDAFPDDKCCATRVEYVAAREWETAPVPPPPPRFCAKHNVDGACLTCREENAAALVLARETVGTCSHNMLAGCFCVHCGRVVPRYGVITDDDRQKAAELMGLPRHRRQAAIEQALADARVDLRVKQS